MKKTIAITVSVCLILSGCATMHYPTAYKVDGKEFKEFKDMDDEKAVKAVVLIYNVQHGAWEDKIARSIALDEYLTMIKKRNSAYIKNSGVLDLKYDKADLAKWKSEDLIKLCTDLEPKAELFYMDAAQELTDVQNADRIIYLTAINATLKELKKRKYTRDAMTIAAQVLTGVLSIAMAMI